MNEICKDIKHKDKAFTYINYERNCPYCKIVELEQQLAEANSRLVNWPELFDQNMRLAGLNDTLREQNATLEKQLSNANDFSNKGIEVVHNQRVTIDRIEAQNAKLVDVLKYVRLDSVAWYGLSDNLKTYIVDVLKEVKGD